MRELVLGLDLCFGYLQTPRDLRLIVGAPPLQSLSQRVQRWRRYEHLYGLRHRVADLARPLHLDLEHDRHPGGETALELAAQRAIATAQAAAGVPLPDAGAAFLSVTDADKPGVFAIAQLLHDAGFEIFATRGTAQAIARMGVPASQLNKISEGSPHVLELIEAGKIHLVVNTPTGSGARSDGWEIRNAAITRGIPCLTTLAAGVSAARAIAHASSTGPAEVICLQELHRLGGEGEASSRERTLTS